MTKLSTPPFFLNSLLLYLLIYCLVQQRVYQSRVHDVEELMDIWHGLQPSEVGSAIDARRVRIRACVRAKDGHFELWQYANWVSGHRSSEVMFQIRRMFFFKLVNNSQSYRKSSGQLCHRELERAVATFLNFYVSHGSATRFFWRNGEKCCIYVVDNSLMFPTVKWVVCMVWWFPSCGLILFLWDWVKACIWPELCKNLKVHKNSTLNIKIVQTCYAKWLSICSGYCEFNALHNVHCAE